MNTLLAEISSLAQIWLAIGIGVFIRIGAAFAVLPGFGEAFIPLRIRLAAALAFTLVVAPAMGPSLVPQDQWLPPLHYFLTEAVAGLTLGIGLRIIVHALQIAGSMAAQATSLAQISGGITPDPQPAIGGLLLLSGLTLAVMSGLHIHIARAFVASYNVFPAGEFPLAGDLGRWGIGRVGASFSLAFSLAAPFLIASLLYNLALGVISKAMPQLMVALVGAPAITWGALVLLLLTIPFILTAWFSVFQNGLTDPFGGL